MNIPIHIACIEHMSGMDLHSAPTEEALNAKVAAYCRSQWDTVSELHSAAAPEDDALCVRTYFDDHQNDSLTTDVDSVEIPLTVVCEIICQKPHVSVHPDEASARKHAVACAMENLWNEDVFEDTARAEFETYLEDADCVCEDDYEVHILTP